MSNIDLTTIHIIITRIRNSERNLQVKRIKIMGRRDKLPDINLYLEQLN